MKTVLLVLVLCISATASAQRNDDYDQMMSKSIRLKTTGWKFLVAGTTLTSASLIIANQVRSNSSAELNEQMFLAEMMFVGGLSSIVASVPQFFRSAAYKRRAMQLDLKSESTPSFSKNYRRQTSIPVLQLKIPL